MVSDRKSDPFSFHSMVLSSVNDFEVGRFEIPGFCKTKLTMIFCSL